MSIDDPMGSNTIRRVCLLTLFNPGPPVKFYSGGMDSEAPKIILDARSLTWTFLTQLDSISPCLSLLAE
jgi:hypothetical protein